MSAGGSLSLRRLPWYAGWQSGEAAVQNRRTAANDLLDVIRTRHFDTQTLHELVDILQFELLCYALRRHEDDDEDAAFVSISPSDSSPAVPTGPLQPALFRPWTESLIEELASCLLRSVNDTVQRERDLQSRALLHALLLLRAQGTRLLHHDLYDGLHKQLEQRFRDLKWTTGSTGPLSAEQFWKLQCSYVLSASAEFMAKFEQARPWQHVILARVGLLISFGLSLSSSAWSGGDFNMQDVWNHLNAALRSRSKPSDEDYDDVFYIQELVAVVSALQLHAKVVDFNSNTRITAMMMIRLSKDLAQMILDKTLSILDEYYPISNVTPPSSFWEHYLPSSCRGPPEFDLYHFLYGLMDCAAQLSAIVDPKTLSHPEEDTLQLLSLTGLEPSLRWKADEFLISICSDYPTLKTQLTTASSEENKAVVDTELTGMYNMSFNAVYPRAALPPATLQPGGSEDAKITAAEWTEGTFPTPNISTESDMYSIFSSKHTKKWFGSAGLSPDCYAAFLLDAETVTVYNTLPLKKNEHRDPLLIQSKLSSNLIASALSDRFLATISTDELQVTAYNLGGDKPTYVLTPDKFETSGDGHQWVPRCVAIFDAPERTWIAIAGQTGTNASIRIYEINASMDLATSTLRDDAFNRPSPDPLKDDLIESIVFSNNGGRLACTTRNNRVIVWFLSNNLRPLYAPFVIKKPYAVETDVRGITAASVFLSPSARCYVLCTTSPSSERELYGGEFSFISPVATSASKVSSRVEHALVELSKCTNILTGAASPTGNIVAVLEDSGRIYFFPLEAHPKTHYGGLCGRKMVRLKKKLESQEVASTMSMRFCVTRQGLEFFAIDNRGTIVHKLIESNPTLVRRNSHRPSATSNASILSGSSSSHRSSRASG